MKLNDILAAALKKSASDVHIKAGLVPVIRKHGKLRPLQAGLPQLTSEQVEEMAMSMLDEEQRATFARMKEVDVGYGVSGRRTLPREHLPPAWIDPHGHPKYSVQRSKFR